MSEEFRVGEDRLVCDEWHARDRTVVIRPRDPDTPPSASSITRVLDELVDRGVQRVLTAALADSALPPFAAAGFRPHEELCVLRHPLDTIPDAGEGHLIRRGSPRRDADAVARIDHEAFEPGGSLDRRGLASVLRATSVTRFRLVGSADGTPDGYAVSGIAADCGYLQRIAVVPGRRRHGLARSLVVDSLRWMRRRRVREAWVNTQVGNRAARRLYRATGFVPTPGHLAVRVWDRPDDR